VRVLFLRAVMSLLISKSWDFRGHLQSAEEEGMSFTHKAFDNDAFVGTVSRALRPLVRKLVNTQMFAQFAVALVDTQSQAKVDSAGRPMRRRTGGEVRRARSATAKPAKGGMSDVGSSGDNDLKHDPAANPGRNDSSAFLATNLQGNFWHLLEAVAVTGTAILGVRPPPPHTPRTSVDFFPKSTIRDPQTPRTSLGGGRPAPPHTPQESVNLDTMKPLPPPTSKRRSLTFSGPFPVNASALPPSTPRTPATPAHNNPAKHADIHTPANTPPVNVCISSPGAVAPPPPPPPRPPPPASTRANRVQPFEPADDPLPPPSGRAKKRAKNKLTRIKSMQVTKRNGQPGLTQRLCRAAKTRSGTPLSNAYDNGLESTNLSAHGVCILHVSSIPPVTLSKDEQSRIKVHECLWGMRSMRSPVPSFYDVSSVDDATLLAQLEKFRVASVADEQASQETNSKAIVAGNTSATTKKQTKLSRRTRRHSTMAALGTNDLSYLGVSEVRFAEIQKSIWTLVLPTTGRRCSFVAKRGRRGSMILAKGGAVPSGFGFGGGSGGGGRPSGERKKKVRVGSLESLPDGDREKDSSGKFSTPVGSKAGTTEERLQIGGSRDAPYTASKFGKTPKYGKTPGASRSKAAAQNRPSRRLMLSSTRSLSKMTISPSTALHSPTAEDIHDSAAQNMFALSPSMNAIISARRYEIAHKKYRALVQERRGLRARLEEIEAGMLLESAVCVLVRRWRMKQKQKEKASEEWQKDTIMWGAKKVGGAKKARC
jgi:hypothetical protein